MKARVVDRSKDRDHPVTSQEVNIRPLTVLSPNTVAARDAKLGGSGRVLHAWEGRHDADVDGRGADQVVE